MKNYNKIMKMINKLKLKNKIIIKQNLKGIILKVIIARINYK